MKKINLLLPVLFLISCANNTSPQEEVISLYSDSSRLYVDNLLEKDSPILKTYHHKKYGDIPYVEIEEYCKTFPVTEIKEEKTCIIKDDKFIVSGIDNCAYIFDAKNDTVKTTDNITFFFMKNKRINNGLPFDIYRGVDFEKVVKDSNKTSVLKNGKERLYDCKKYSFDIVYEKGVYYAPFGLLNLLFYNYFNSAYIYNGKNYFDLYYLDAGSTTVQYCYSSNGNFLLDRSGGKFGAVLYKKVESKEKDEVFRFVNTIESSGQTNVVSCFKNGKGNMKSYDKDGKYIDEGVYTKLDYVFNEEKKELEIKYYSVLDEEDTEPISDIFTMLINMDETLFGKNERSKAVADFSYQELRFTMYELYGDTINKEVRDFDNFIKDKEYKDDLLSLDIKKYDEAMAKFLYKGIDDCHTTIGHPSIYGEPTFANANYYTITYEGPRYKVTTDSKIKYLNDRKSAGLDAGLDIVNKTAFISFDKFTFNKDVKSINEYKDSDPEKYVDDSMELFASSFNKIKENDKVENVVIDLTCNPGGRTASIAYLLGYLTDDPSVVTAINLNESIIDYHYQVDLDQNGKFGEESDTFKGKYNFYVLTSKASFSCSSLFTTACRNNNLAKVIGEKSGGGSCPISDLCNSSGYFYHSSSELTTLLKTSDGYVTNDGGIEPDIKIEASYFYNHAYIDEVLQSKK